MTVTVRVTVTVTGVGSGGDGEIKIFSMFLNFDNLVDLLNLIYWVEVPDCVTSNKMYSIQYK